MPHYPSTLRFVEADEHYSIYLDRDGNDVYVQHGTGTILVDFYDLDIDNEWGEWLRKTRAIYDSYSFLESLRAKVTEPDLVDDEITFCDACATPKNRDTDELVLVNGDEIVCEPCLEQHFTTCSDCGDWVDCDNTTWTLHEESVCEGCVENYYGYCDDCDGYYYCDYSHDHDHDRDCDCDIPHQVFRVPNDGKGLLGNDERTTVALPAGEVDGEGFEKIGHMIRAHGMKVYRDSISDEHGNYTIASSDEAHAARIVNSKWADLSYRLEEVGSTWQRKDGNFTKRLSKFAYKEFGLKLPAEMISEIGNIGAAHSKGVDFGVEVTRRLNLPAYEFAHAGSCWWTDYNASRCALKSNGGFGLRSWRDGSHDADGRAWVMPLRRTEHGDLVPTFETETPDAYVVFNGYGDLSGYIPARIVAHMAGMTYRKISFSADPMYVNSSAGYLVTSEEIAQDYNGNGSISLYLDEHSSLAYDEEREAQRESVSTEEIVNLLAPVNA